MKKTLSIISVIAIMVTTLFSVSAFATETKTDALLDKISNSDEIAVILKSGDTALGSSTDAFYIKGNSAAYDYNTGFFNVRVVLTDGNAYAYLPSFPYFYVKVNGTGLAGIDVKSLIKNAMGVTKGVTAYEKSYEEEIDGTKYYVEQYNDRAQTVLKFCYVGDELKLLSVTDKSTGSVQNTYFESYSFSVDSSAVAVPGGIDLTPILSALFVAFLSSAL